MIPLFLQKIFLLTLDNYKSVFLKYLDKKIRAKEPANLYEPITYILNLGGKRLRPILTLMTCEAFGGKLEDALDAALAVEIFHNFSLVHDDIMDEAPVRRGKATVHKKWDINTGILSGDAMMILAYQFFESYEPTKFRELARLFSKTALEVCEGQQYDIDFETRNDVTIPEYLKMIEYKTAVLVAAALKMGAIVAGTSEKDAQLIYDYGINLGIAFQLQDDYLDVFADADFGKQKAGDIIENKKTWLYLKSLELSLGNDRSLLEELYENKTIDDESKIDKVVSLFNKYKIPNLIKTEIAKYTKDAYQAISSANIDYKAKKSFIDLGMFLMNRTV